MSLQISYFAGQGWDGTPVYRGWMSSEARTLSGTAASSGVTPNGAAVVRITARSDARIRYGIGVTATNDGASISLNTGETIDLAAIPGGVVSGITAG